MATITNFRDWISQCDLESYEDQYCLYRAVQEAERWGSFECKKAKQGYFVYGDDMDDVLLLASDKARDYFMKTIERTYAGDLTMEGYYEFCKAASKDD